MLQQKTTFSRFMNWWQTGLLAPFSRFSRRPTVIRISDGELYDAEAQSLSIFNVDSLKQSQRVYLNATPELVMLKQISESQSGLELESLIRDIFPFEPDEIMAVWNTDKTQILAILKADVAAEFELLKSHDISVRGLAFVDQSNPERTDFLFTELNQNGAKTRPSISRVWPASALMLTVSLCLSFVFLSQHEVSQQATIGIDLAALESQRQDQELPKDKALLVETVAFIKQQRSADDVSTLLKILTAHLTASTVVDQLIWSDGELLIDASAQSAIQLQSNLEGAEVFMDVEFVSSISRNNVNDSERFRIKARVPNALNNATIPDAGKGGAQ